MAVAMAYGIPRSQLLGREPAEITIYEYDDDGRLTRSVTTREPRWTEEDIAWALAGIEEQADRCPKCSLPLSETTAMNDGEPVHVYKVPKPKRCHGCDARIKAQDEDAKMPSKRPDARMWVVEEVSRTSQLAGVDR